MTSRTTEDPVGVRPRMEDPVGVDPSVDYRQETVLEKLARGECPFPKMNPCLYIVCDRKPCKRRLKYEEDERHRSQKRE